MRIVVGWDGSGHVLAALAQVAGLFRPGAIEHVEIVLPVWPEVDVARWTDIREQQAIFDDVHQAAAQTAADEASRLSALFQPLAASVAARTEDGDAVAILLGAVKQSRADVLLIAAGIRASSSHVDETLQRLLRGSTVPTLVLRPAFAPHA